MMSVHGLLAYLLLWLESQISTRGFTSLVWTMPRTIRRRKWHLSSALSCKTTRSSSIQTGHKQQATAGETRSTDSVRRRLPQWMDCINALRLAKRFKEIVPTSSDLTYSKSREASRGVLCFNAYSLSSNPCEFSELTKFKRLREYRLSISNWMIEWHACSSRGGCFVEVLKISE